MMDENEKAAQMTPEGEERWAAAALALLQQRCHEVAVEKGWYDPPKSVPEALMLCVEELVEALQYARASASDDELRIVRSASVTAGGKPEGLPVE